MSKVRINRSEAILYRGSVDRIPEYLLEELANETCCGAISERPGYVRRDEIIICMYSGRYGDGYSILYPSYASSRYCVVQYKLFKGNCRWNMRKKQKYYTYE